ncbi:hypothetical protein Q8F55_006579 [Vanrija albida]|uniref:Amino acid permease/ SLC12A domain-containing protein n=1 Tax=Vanrija albida TaxID=181172 RepID=A0ABR3PXN6_9TREE
MSDIEKNVKDLENETHVNVYSAEEHDDLTHTHVGEHGTKRDLPPRVVSMIALAGTIGTGLFLGSGSALTLGGPVGAFLGYTVMGVFVGFMMYCLGEMTCYAPNIGGFIEMGNKYVDPAVGFAIGINYILQQGMSIPSELSAIAVMITYWDHNPKHMPGYIVAVLFLPILANILAVKFYGEIEFFFSCLKLVTLVGLVIFGLIVDVGGVPPHHEFIGGRYWRTEPFNDNFKNVTPVSFSRFLGFWAVLTKAAFSYGNIESIGLVAGEAHNPRQSMRKAIRAIFYRVVGIYMLSMLMIGLTVSQHSPLLLSAQKTGSGTAAASPFVIMCRQTGVKVLPHIINAVVITSALSAANEQVYALSRTFVALARQRSMPSFFLITSKQGVPYAGVLVGLAFGCLAFLSVSDGSAQAFEWLSNLSALSSLLSWIFICVCYIGFKRAVDAQGLDRRTFTLRSWWQPYVAWACTIFFSLVLLLNGFGTFMPKFNVSNFFAAYITIPVVFISWLVWKLVKRTKMVDPNQVDLSNGPAEALKGTRYDLAHNPNAGTYTAHAQEYASYH